jgi:hypothetical protein
MQHTSLASRLRCGLSDVVAGLSDLIRKLRIRRFQQSPGPFFVVAPEFYFEERSADELAIQLALKRKYETIAEILNVVLLDAPQDLKGRLEQADRQFRDWLELRGSWGVTLNPAENAEQAETAGKEFEQILGVLDVASSDETILIPDTNSLLSTADPTHYRQVAGQDSFVFLLLPTVLGELDRLKVEHRNPEVQEKARKIITRVKGWRKQGALSTGIIIDKSITVRTLHSEPDMNRTLSWLDANNKDDRIIASVLALQGEHPSSRVILISGDINLLNKADAAMIATTEGP